MTEPTVFPEELLKEAERNLRTFLAVLTEEQREQAVHLLQEIASGKLSVESVLLELEFPGSTNPS